MKTRVITALLALPVVVGAIALESTLPVMILATLLVGIGCTELQSMQPTLRQLQPIAAAVLLIAYWFLLDPAVLTTFLTAQLGALTIFGAIAAHLWLRRPSALLFQAATLWIAAPLAALPLIPPLEYHARHLSLLDPIFLIVVPIWVGDTLAYLVGKRFGRRPLAPTISPKKTVEGAIANVLGCVVAATVVGHLLGYGIWFSAAIGTAGGTLGQAGDLFQSALKRRAGLKDVGALLPGHGGVLDRIDSLLFAIPLQALLLCLVRG